MKPTLVIGVEIEVVGTGLEVGNEAVGVDGGVNVAAEALLTFALRWAG